MGHTGTPPEITPDVVRTVFSAADHPSLTTGEVAERLDCPLEEAGRHLEKFATQGELETRRIDGETRLWWRQDEAETSDDRQSTVAEYSAFVSAVKDYAIFMLDPDGNVTSWNEGAERIKGYEEGEIVGEHLSTFYTDGEVEAGVPEQNLEAAIERGRVEDEGWRVRKDGSRFWGNVVVTAIHDADGTLQGFTKVTRDMTERRAYEQELREERDFTEHILETVPVSICVLAPDGTVARANERMLDRIGLDEASLPEFNVTSLEIYDSEGDAIPLEAWPWTRVAETGEPVHDFQCQADLPDVGRRWLSLNAAPIHGDQYEEERIVVTVDDITEQKEREQQLRREYTQTQKLLRTAPIAVAVQSAAGQTVLANRRAQEALGLSEQEFIDEPEDADQWEIYDGDGAPLSDDETPSARVLATGEPVFDEELVIESPGGDRMQFRVNAAPVFDSDGTVDRVITAGEDITELKEREGQLEQRKTELETELSEILGRISDAFYALDDEWRFTHLNEQAAAIMQRSRGDLLGHRVWEVFPEAADVYHENFARAMDTQEPVTFEVHAEELDSWLEFNAYPSESGLSIYFRDITDRKEREQTLAKYETIVETVEDGIYVKDDEGRFTMVNDAYAALTGYDRDELIGAHASLVVDEATIARTREHKERASMGEGTEPTVEAMLHTAAGDAVPAEGTFAAIETADGGTEQVGVVRDISERKEYERKLEESERRYRTLAENFPNGIVALFDEDFRYVAAGGELIGELGIDRDEVIGQSIYERYPDELLEEVEPYFEAALDGVENDFEVAYLGRELLAHTLPIDPAGGTWTGMLVIQDVTERNEYHRQLEESNERLEQFAYAASHDLQEPLRMVSSYLQLIDMRYSDALDDDGEEFLEFAVDGADRMRDMIEGLLEYSRVETQGNPFEPVELEAVVDDVREDLRLLIDEQDATLAVDSLPSVEGDTGQLHQLFQNLLSNAIEYSGDEPPRVRVSADRTNGKWTISVTDDGIGIDPADQERIFEVFQRVHTTEEYSGTGIGLALCQRIVERHGGEIRVESDPGEGTTFSFTLPVTADAADG